MDRSSWIRRMFEEGEERKAKLVKIFGNEWENVNALFVNNWGNKRSIRDIQRIIKNIRENYSPKKTF